MAAAAPSLVGQHCNFVNGPNTFGDFKICSKVYSSRNCDFLLEGNVVKRLKCVKLKYSRIVYGMFVVFVSDFGEMLRACSISFYVLQTGITEKLAGYRGGVHSRYVRHGLYVAVQGVRSVGKL